MIVRSDADVRRDLRLSIGDAAGYGIMAGVAEVFLPAFALALGIRPVLAGLTATIPLLAGGLIQLLAPRAIARVTSLRRWIVACACAQALSFLPLVSLALTGEPNVAVLYLTASIFWASGMAASAAWNAWMARLVPADDRGRFFGRRQGMIQATMLLGLLGAGASLQATMGTPRMLHVFAAMFAVAAAARLVSAFLLSRQGRDVAATPRRRVRLRSIAPRIRGTPRAPVLGYLIAALAAVAVSGPFLTPFLLDQQGLSYAAYTAFTAAVAISKIVALPRLGHLIQRIGARRMLELCAFGIVPLPILWAASDSLVWLIALQVYAGVVWGGFELGMLMTLFDVDDEAERTTLQVAFSGLQAVSTAAASMLGGALLAGLGADHDAYVWLFGISTVARLAAVVLLVRQLPRAIARLPGFVVTRTWTLAIRPWGGTLIRPLVEGLEKLGVTARDRDRGGRDGDG